MENKPIITIKEARRLLGKAAQDMNEQEVMRAVKDLQNIAKKYLESRDVKITESAIGLDDGLPKPQPEQA